MRMSGTGNCIWDLLKSILTVSDPRKHQVNCTCVSVHFLLGIHYNCISSHSFSRAGNVPWYFKSKNKRQNSLFLQTFFCSSPPCLMQYLQKEDDRIPPCWFSLPAFGGFFCFFLVLGFLLLLLFVCLFVWCNHISQQISCFIKDQSLNAHYPYVHAHIDVHICIYIYVNGEMHIGI